MVSSYFNWSAPPKGVQVTRAGPSLLLETSVKKEVFLFDYCCLLLCSALVGAQVSLLGLFGKMLLKTFRVYKSFSLLLKYAGASSMVVFLTRFFSLHWWRLLVQLTGSVQFIINTNSKELHYSIGIAHWRQRHTLRLAHISDGYMRQLNGVATPHPENYYAYIMTLINKEQHFYIKKDWSSSTRNAIEAALEDCLLCYRQGQPYPLLEAATASCSGEDLSRHLIA